MPALAIDVQGWYNEARRCDSPNCDARPEGVSPSLLVIHNISLPPGRFGGLAVEALFTNQIDHDAHPYFATLKELRVSAHFFIRRDGEIIQFVSCDQRAWHAGVSSFEGRARCNDFSIGVELEGTDDMPFTAAQYKVLADLANVLGGRYKLSAVAGHNEIAPGRKTDPGPFFDWDRFLAMLEPRLRRPTTT